MARGTPPGILSVYGVTVLSVGKLPFLVSTVDCRVLGPALCTSLLLSCKSLVVSCPEVVLIRTFIVNLSGTVLSIATHRPLPIQKSPTYLVNATARELLKNYLFGIHVVYSAR